MDARSLTMPDRLRRYMERGDWVHLATFREDEQAGWVLYRERAEQITDLFAVVLTGEDLVLAKLTGDFNALVMNALADERTALPFFRTSETQEEANAEDAVVEAAQFLGP